MSGLTELPSAGSGEAPWRPSKGVGMLVISDEHFHHLGANFRSTHVSTGAKIPQDRFTLYPVGSGLDSGLKSAPAQKLCRIRLGPAKNFPGPDPYLSLSTPTTFFVNLSPYTEKIPVICSGFGDFKNGFRMGSEKKQRKRNVMYIPEYGISVLS